MPTPQEASILTFEQAAKLIADPTLRREIAVIRGLSDESILADCRQVLATNPQLTPPKFSDYSPSQLARMDPAEVRRLLRVETAANPDPNMPKRQ